MNVRKVPACIRSPEKIFIEGHHYRLDYKPLHVLDDINTLDPHRRAESMILFSAGLIYAGVGSLALQDVNRKIKCASAKVNRSRTMKRKEPFYSHTLVTVRQDPTPRTKAGMPRSHTRLGFSAPMRIHWRRGHIRRLASGSLTQVRPCLVGDRTQGIVTHDYRVSA